MLYISSEKTTIGRSPARAKGRFHVVVVEKPARASASLLVALAMMLSTTPPLPGQAGAPRTRARACGTTAGGEWPTYGGDLGHTRYSPLDQINAANFSKLEVAWRFKTDSLGPRPEFNLESTPLMVNGTLYSTAGTRRAVVALDAATGELLWMHSEREGARGAAAPRQLSGRGLAYWTDGTRGADPLRHARVSAGRARREDRSAGRRLRPQRRRRSEARTSIRSSISTGAGRPALDADRREERRDRRRRVRDRREPEEQEQCEGRGPRLRRAHRQAPVALPHDPAARRVRQRHLGEGFVGATPATPASGRRSRSTKSWASRTCRSSCRRTTTTAASARGTRCSARASSPSICRPASASGTTSWCITASGTWTSRARRSWPTSPSTAGRSRPSRSRPSRASSTCSIA